MKQCVEIRSYNLKPGIRENFHRLVVERAGPMLQRWKVDVVDYGPSPHDADSYYLIRAYPSLEAREQSQGAFYGSAEWRDGPRDSILALIESYATIVLILDDLVVQGLRRAAES
jgi:hypothetical protein